MKPAEIIVDPDFETRLPPLTSEEKAVLRQNIIDAGGIMSAVVVWKEEKTLIDGHNRLGLYDELTNEHGMKLTFPDPVQLSFASREDVLQWMDRHARGQRNLTEQWKGILRGRAYNERKKLITNPDGVNLVGGHADHQPNEKTAETIAKEWGVGERTVRRDADRAVVYDVVERQYGKASEEARLAMTSPRQVVESLIKKGEIEPEVAVKTLQQEKNRRAKERKAKARKNKKAKAALYVSDDTVFQTQLAKVKSLGRVPEDEFWGALGAETSQRFFRNTVEELHYMHIQEDADGTCELIVDEAERDLCTAVHAQLERMQDACRRANKFHFEVAEFKKLTQDMYELVKKASMHKSLAEV